MLHRTMVVAEDTAQVERFWRLKMEEMAAEPAAEFMAAAVAVAPAVEMEEATRAMEKMELQEGRVAAVVS